MLFFFYSVSFSVLCFRGGEEADARAHQVGLKHFLRECVHQTELANTLGHLLDGFCHSDAIHCRSDCDLTLADAVCHRLDTMFPGNLCGFVVGFRRCRSCCCCCLCCCFGWAGSVLREQLSKPPQNICHWSSLVSATLIRQLVRPSERRRRKSKSIQTLCSQKSQRWWRASASKLPSFRV